uniref:Uncharacterized protein n=1 Tax=Arundo donax TaxID=35708 RepID=A0A0A9H3A4_ARUDO
MRSASRSLEEYVSTARRVRHLDGG